MCFSYLQLTLCFIAGRHGPVYQGHSLSPRWEELCRHRWYPPFPSATTKHSWQLSHRSCGPYMGWAVEPWEERRWAQGFGTLFFPPGVRFSKQTNKTLMQHVHGCVFTRVTAFWSLPSYKVKEFSSFLSFKHQPIFMLMQCWRLVKNWTWHVIIFRPFQSFLKVALFVFASCGLFEINLAYLFSSRPSMSTVLPKCEKLVRFPSTASSSFEPNYREIWTSASFWWCRGLLISWRSSFSVVGNSRFSKKSLPTVRAVEVEKRWRSTEKCNERLLERFPDLIYPCFCPNFTALDVSSLRFITIINDI